MTVSTPTVTISEDIKSILIRGFQSSLIWQDGDLDDYCPVNLSDQTVTDISNLVDSFFLILNDDQKKALIENPSQFGHWLCLEQMGHGSGFYDSTDCTVSGVSDTLNGTELARPGDLCLVDGIIHSDLYKYGS